MLAEQSLPSNSFVRRPSIELAGSDIPFAYDEICLERDEVLQDLPAN